MTEILERPLWEETLPPESETLELLAAPSFERIGPTVAAFLNGNGGQLVVGVEDSFSSSTSRRILGVPDAEAVRIRLRDHLAQTITPSATVSVSVVNTAGKDCIFLEVPRGQAPPYVYADRIFVRAGGQVRAALPRELSALVSSRYVEPVRWERLPALGFGTGDFDEAEIRATARDAENRSYPFFTSSHADTISVLERLNLWQDGEPLNGAVVLFGRDPARRYPQTRLRAVRYAGEDLAVQHDLRVVDGHAFDQLQAAESFLRRELSTVSTLPERGLIRDETSAYPWTAVREALVNALVHRDYAAYDGGVSISLYPDRLEFWNAGTLPEGWTVGDLKVGHVSRPHNPDIAHVFFLRGYMERFGTGARRILAACAAAGLPEPEWELTGGGIRLTLRQAVPPVRPPAPLTERAVLFLRETPPGTAFRRRDYGDRFPGVSERTVRNDLARLVELGYLEPNGSGPRVAYVRTEKPPT